ncbi:MAG: DUF4886 domain-containing protein [Bacteroidaceae bacterium]|nr:DUF4886 domain-containing protein [Bacteroidaceae bacterium]
MIFRLILFSFFFFLATYTEAQIKSDTIKILAIGNSFSEDGVEYLDEIANAAGVPIIIGNLSIGGCSLQKHWENIAADRHQYVYRKNKNNKFTSTKKYSILQGLMDENWDYISIQQASQYSGMEQTYYPYIKDILIYLKNYATNPHVKFAFQQTWAYAQNSTHGGFKNYGKDQNEMYRRIVETTKKVTQQENISIVIPSGTAIQNLREVVGDTLCRDGYHLSYTLGRYTAACAWFEALCKRKITGNSFIPNGISLQITTEAQKAAHAAIKRPYQISNKK